MANYKVNNVTGSNSNDGINNPWASIQHALASIAANQGHILNVENSGTPYDLGFTPVEIVSGVAIQSASETNKAKIQGTFFASSGKSYQNIIIQNLDFEGKNLSYDRAFSFANVSGFYVANLKIENYSQQAASLANISASSQIPKCRFGNIYIRNCAFNNRIAGQQSSYSIAIVMKNLSDFYMHDIDLDTRARGGEGIGCIVESGVTNTFNRVKFFNNEIIVDDYSAWGNGYSSQICLELVGTICNDVEIYNNRFNNTLSLSSYYEQGGTNVHHNIWLPEKPDKPSYAIEFSQGKISAHHNLIIGGNYPLANFADNNDFLPGLEAHHNIIDNEAFSLVVAHIKTTGGIKFYNNTVVSRNSNTFFYFKTENVNTQIKNNIFCRVNSGDVDCLNATSGVDRNLFRNVIVKGSNAIAADPSLKFAASDINTPAYYQLNAGSPAINTGIAIAGYTDGYSGSAPDLGALEYGQTPFKVGVNALPLPSDLIINPFTGQTVGSGTTTPAVPTNVAITLSEPTDAIVNWSQSGTVTSWYVAYKKDTDTDWIYLQVTQPTITLIGLTANSNYFVAVSACDATVCSGYTNSVSFATTSGSTTTMATINVYSSNGSSQTLMQTMSNIALDSAGTVAVTLPVL